MDSTFLISVAESRLIHGLKKFFFPDAMTADLKQDPLPTSPPSLPDLIPLSAPHPARPPPPSPYMPLPENAPLCGLWCPLCPLGQKVCLWPIYGKKKQKNSEHCGPWCLWKTDNILVALCTRQIPLVAVHT